MADDDKPDSEVHIELRSIQDYNDPINNFKVPEDEAYRSEEESGFRLHPDNIVENYFYLVAIKGCTFFPWSKIRDIFLWKITTVVDDWIEKEALDNLDNEDNKGEKLTYYRRLKEEILNKVQSFEGAPFTIQRLAELLATPQKNYKDVGKYLRALERTVNIVTCVSPLGERVAKTEEDSEEEENEPNIRVENSFIVSVDELDDPVEVKKAKLGEEPSLNDLNKDEKNTDKNCLIVDVISADDKSEPLEMEQE